ncbi:hypothetical protein SDC9_28835 [bioreactor metagenome]|uniref:Uncharacterized protein n=1 Tax=bioreactor metagenome TaxID=1076179 RepID=A0A644UUZ2_9ZZZZ
MQAGRVCVRLRGLGLARGPHLAEGGTVLTELEPARDAREARHQRCMALRVAQDFGHVDIGHGEAAADHVAVRAEMGFEHGKRPVQPVDGAGDRAFGTVGLAGGKGELDRERRLLDRGCAVKRPLRHQRLFAGVARAQRAAGLLREVEVDRERLGQDQPSVLHHRNRAGGRKPQEIGRAGVEGRARGLRVNPLRLEPVGLDHRLQLPRQAELLERPDVARGARAVHTVEGDHGGSPCPCLFRRGILPEARGERKGSGQHVRGPARAARAPDMGDAFVEMLVVRRGHLLRVTHVLQDADGPHRGFAAGDVPAALGIPARGAIIAVCHLLLLAPGLPRGSSHVAGDA